MELIEMCCLTNDSIVMSIYCDTSGEQRNFTANNGVSAYSRAYRRRGKGVQGPGHPITGSQKSFNNVASTFCNTVCLLPKDLRFDNGGVKFVSFPGRHLTSVRSCAYANSVSSNAV